MKRLVKTREGSELNSYYDMMRCACGSCGCACACLGNDASMQYIIGGPQVSVESGFRSAPSY